MDVDKLKNFPVDLSKVRNVVNNKKIVHDKLVTKVNDIDTSRFVLKTKFDTDKKNVVIKVNLLKKADYITKTIEIESKIPSIRRLAATSALTAIENKIPDVRNLGKRTDNGAKISDIESKYVTTANYNRFTEVIVDNSTKSKHLVNKSAFDGFMNKKSF